MREAGPGPSPESLKHDQRRETVLKNLGVLDEFAREKLGDQRWTPHETSDGRTFLGVELNGFFDTRTGRLTSLGGPSKEQIPPYWSSIRMLMGTPKGRTVPESLANYPRVAEWAIPKKVSEQFPEAVAGLGASFRAFELDQKRRHEERRRPL